MDTKKFNGWTNYATWKVNIEIFEGIDWNVEISDGINYDSITHLSNDLKERAEEAITNYGSITKGLAYDYALAFLEDVNYYEIAEMIAKDYPNIIKN